jgi:guanine deaminase
MQHRLGILTALREASVVSKVLGFQQSSKIEADKDRGRSLTPRKNQGLPAIEADADAEQTIDAPARALSAPEMFAGKHLPLETLFYLATLGGAEVCELQDRIGNFKVGKEFDALLVRTGQAQPDTTGNPFEQQLNPALFVEPDDPLEAVFEKFLFAGDDRNVGCDHCLCNESER